MRPRDAQRRDWDSRSRSCRFGISYPPAAPRQRAARRGGRLPRYRGTPDAPLLDHLIRPRQQRPRNRQAERFGRLEVDHQLELGWLLDRQIGGLGALEDLVDVVGAPPKEVGRVGRIGDQQAVPRHGGERTDGRETMLYGELTDRCRLAGVCQVDIQDIEALAGERREGMLELARMS